jgi:ubiquinone/menaquinone biosynthesis C-methylase UbiE
MQHDINRKRQAEIDAVRGGLQVHGPPTEESSRLFCLRYLHDCEIGADAFTGCRLLDVGAGPHPCLSVFNNCTRQAIDPLLDQYRELGFLTEKAADDITYHPDAAEHMRFRDDYFTGVICVSALDHVDDFARAAQEIRRVVVADPRFVMHVHYHPPTLTEPIEINDELFLQHFGWVPHLRPWRRNAKDSWRSMCPPGEQFVIWKNI